MSNYSAFDKGRGGVAVLPILPNGHLGEKVQNIVFEEGSGHVKGRQESGHAHSTTFSPDGKYLYASDLGNDKVYTFRYNPNKPQPLEADSSRSSASCVAVPERRRKWKQFVEISGARENNLQNINVKFPLGVLTAVTGVSGSGKTSLVKKILYPAIKKIIGGYGEQTGNFDRLGGDYTSISEIELVDQNPIGKSSRSNPVTYVKAYDEVRALFADLPQARSRNLKPSHFSFNVDGGRCEICQGEGSVTIEMQFMADIHLKCEACGGRRFKDDVLAVEFQGMNIHQILGMTVDDAISFFNSPEKSKYTSQMEKVAAKLQPLADVGLGYVRLGQSSSTLSGGEAQRIKLASFIGRGQSSTGCLFIFDEPTTGLHFHDIKKLLNSFSALIDQGHSLIVIEHNTDVIKSADWLIDMGPEAGDGGGTVVYEGVPLGIKKCAASHTAKYL